MDNWTFDAGIAGAIINGRMLKKPVGLRATAEASLGPISDKLWRQLEPKWKVHDKMTTEELRRAIAQSPPDLP